MEEYRKITIFLKQDIINQIEMIVSHKKTKDLLFKGKYNNESIEKFIVGCVCYYLKKVQYIEDLSGINDLGKPYRLKNNIKEYLKNIGMTQNELSQKTGINQSNISLILSNRNQPSLDYFLRIWIALECPEIDWLLYRED